MVELGGMAIKTENFRTRHLLQLELHEERGYIRF